MVKIEPTSANGLSKTSAVDTFQIRSVAHERFVNRLGELPEWQMGEIARALAIVLRIRQP